MLKRIDSVLLVEDDRITNFLNERLLRKLNITESIKVATNGEEALQYLEKTEASGKPLPDLIFLDINMPVMDGLEFLQEVQQNFPSTRQRLYCSNVDNIYKYKRYGHAALFR